ncbi:YjhX family toxin [Mesorhizobium sp. CAU 1732]|uniref:YjhX family toxin n=1 Tax=Mesorhizobium sp. CAU 1732 TaxID=3140358 RepID=UPI00326139B5
MNISRNEQRVLHVLGQGGFIRHERSNSGSILSVSCFTRNGHLLSDCTLGVFSKLRRKRLVESKASGPYRISLEGPLVSARPARQSIRK